MSATEAPEDAAAPPAKSFEEMQGEWSAIMAEFHRRGPFLTPDELADLHILGTTAHGRNGMEPVRATVLATGGAESSVTVESVRQVDSHWTAFRAVKCVFCDDMPPDFDMDDPFGARR